MNFSTFQPIPAFLNEKLQKEVFNYARQNLAKVTIYIKDPYVSKYVTEEKITEIAFVGTVGGVLGLFMGFSFISAVEIIYVFCIKFIQVKVKHWNRNTLIKNSQLQTKSNKKHLEINQGFLNHYCFHFHLLIAISI